MTAATLEQPDADALLEEAVAVVVEAQARGAQWPEWLPPAAVVEWVALQLALVDLGREPLCADDPDRWWSNRASDVDDAKAVCAWCPVQRLCREYALAADEPGGTWGGMSDAERRAITGRRR